MRREIPEGVLEMLSIPGLRPDKVLKLHKQLGIASLDELEAAARQDRIKDMKGLGPSLQRKVVQGLEIKKAALGSRHMTFPNGSRTAEITPLRRARRSEQVPILPLSALADLLQSGQRVKTATGIERDPRDRPARLRSAI
jgi:Helix-hairpin-helix domain